MAKLTRNLFIPFLDTTRGSETPTWVPIDLSTIFEFSFNPNEEDYSYICYANDSSEVTSYAPELAQEIVLDNENEMYEFIYPLCMSMPTGSFAKVPVLIAEPDMTTGQPTKGRMWPEAVVVPDNLNTPDGKISFNLKLNGAQKVGTVAGVGTGKVTFTETSGN